MLSSYVCDTDTCPLWLPQLTIEEKVIVPAVCYICTVHELFHTLVTGLGLSRIFWPAKYTLILFEI